MMGIRYADIAAVTTSLKNEALKKKTISRVMTIFFILLVLVSYAAFAYMYP